MLGIKNIISLYPGMSLLFTTKSNYVSVGSEDLYLTLSKFIILLCLCHKMLAEGGSV